MIINIGPLDLWVGNIPINKNALLPRFRYFDGGCYWKLSFLWLKFLLELSGSKKDNREYKQVTKQELDKIIRGLK